MIRFAILLFLCLTAALAQEKASQRHLQDQVDNLFAKWNTTSSPGCALSVIKDGQIVYKRGYGMADLDHDVPITSETVFHVASISKQFTAASILLLAQEGKLSLDDDVRKYVSELPDFGARITLRHLIHHTSGLRDQWELLSLAGWRYSLDLITDDDVLDVMSRQKELNFKPGEKHVYCNTGYTLLAQVVKRVSGKSLREFTVERIFQPLGMNNTHFRDDHAEIVKHIAYGYVPDQAAGTYRLSVTNFDTVGATSLMTTVEDLARWDENFYHPRVGGQALLEQQLQRGKLNSGKELDYAAGLVHGKYRGLLTVDHGGADAGYRADLQRFPEQHFSVACLCNRGDAAPGDLARKVADIYLADQFKEPAPVNSESSTKGVAVPPETLSSLAGVYWNKSAEHVRRVALRDGKLTAGGLELAALSPTRFQWVVDADLGFVFEPATGSSPPRMAIHQPGEAPEIFDHIPDYNPTSGQLASYAGAYTSQEIEPVYRMEAENGNLVLKRLRSKPQTLRPVLEDYFQGLGAVIHFTRSASGQVTGFVLTGDRLRNFRFTKANR